MGSALEEEEGWVGDGEEIDAMRAREVHMIVLRRAPAQAMLDVEAADGGGGGVGDNESGVRCNGQPQLADGPESSDGVRRHAEEDVGDYIIGEWAAAATAAAAAVSGLRFR